VAGRGNAHVGIGWRPEIAADLLARPAAVGFVELTAEGCATGTAMREAGAVAEIWPVVVHGVKSSFGSASGLDGDRVRKLAGVARTVRASVVSEHVAFVRAGDVEIGHLTGLPFTRDAVRVVARNVAEARRALPDVPLLLENVAWGFRWPDDAMDEGDFHAEVAEATGCDLLLDLGNLHANAVNAGRDPAELLARYPLERVAMLHAAGGVLEDGFYFDTHAHPLPDAVLDLLARTLAKTGEVPVVLERDASFPPFDDLAGELARIGATPAGPARRRPKHTGVAREVEPAARERMAMQQRATATVLIAPQPPADPDLARARDVLRRKRVDDALPLLPTMTAFGAPAATLAARCLEGAPRPPSMVAVRDALRIADAAEGDPVLRDAARGDALVLRARFVVDGDVVRARVGPYLRSATTAGGARWVVKGPGANATVRIVKRGGTR
jgi:uncharacterized protein (UPF0276 family)